jgi:hypothetical protein
LYWGYIATFTKISYNLSQLNSPLHHSFTSSLYSFPRFLSMFGARIGREQTPRVYLLTGTPKVLQQEELALEKDTWVSGPSVASQ